MKIVMRAAALFGACALGILLSFSLCRSIAFRDQVARIFHRGHVVAMTQGKAIYETDADREAGETLRGIVIRENLRVAAAHERENSTDVEREFDLLRSQFGNEKLFREAMRGSDLTDDALKERIADELRGRAWLENQVGGNAADLTEADCRAFYAAHQDFFGLPIRFRAAHLFLAAPDGAPDEVVNAKAAAIAALSERLERGADFAQLVAEASEDEATKTRGGDLGFFSASRMPPEFIAEVAQLKPGETGRPFRSHLGYHIVRLLETKPAEALPFEAARREIEAALRTEKRNRAIAALSKSLSGAQYFDGQN
ncbi:MAG: peptidyl-prolyl cis-trans isomerase [Verrucomicrobiota bacterium]|nr:peptidyl-prolyl cis-trans isomerase [Verrucomicrobiota bacterium]